MKNAKLILLATAACFTVTTAGCGKNDDSKVYELFEGKLSFTASSKLKEIDSDSIGIGEDEYYFAVKNSDAQIAVMTPPIFNQSLKLYAEDLAEYMSEDTDCTNFKSEPCMINERPAYKISYIEDNVPMEMDIIQYGDNYFTEVLIAYPDDKKCQKQIDALLDSMKFSGDYLRTETEEFEYNFLKLTAEPQWDVWETSIPGENEVHIRYSQTDNFKLINAKLTIGVYDEPENPGGKADDKVDSINKARQEVESRYSVPERGTGKFLGCDAEWVSFDTDIPGNYISKNTCYYFNKDGISYYATMSCWNEHYDQFTEEVQPLLDTVELKKAAEDL